MLQILKSLFTGNPEYPEQILDDLKKSYRTQDSEGLLTSSVKWIKHVTKITMNSGFSDTTWHCHAQQKILSALLVHAIAKHVEEHGFEQPLHPLLEHTNSLVGWSTLYEGPAVIPWNIKSRSIQDPDDINYPLIILGLYAHLTMSEDYDPCLPKLFNKLKHLNALSMPYSGGVQSQLQDELQMHVYQTFNHYKRLTTEEFIEHLRRSNNISSRGLHALITSDTLNSQFELLKIIQELSSDSPATPYNCGFLPNNLQHFHTIESSVDRLVSTLSVQIKEPYVIQRDLGFEFSEALKMTIAQEHLVNTTITNEPLPTLELDHLP